MLPVKGYGVTLPYSLLTPPQAPRQLTSADFEVAVVEGDTHTYFTPLEAGLRVTFGKSLDLPSLQIFPFVVLPNAIFSF